MANSYKQPPIKNKKNSQILFITVGTSHKQTPPLSNCGHFFRWQFWRFPLFLSSSKQPLCFYPYIHCLYFTTENMRRTCTANNQIAFFKGFSFTMKGVNHLTSAGGGGGDFIKKILETVHISEKKNLAQVHCPNKQSCTYRCTMARLEKLWTLFSYCSHKQILYGTWVRGIAFYMYQYFFTKELLIFMLQANTIFC